MNWQLLLWLDSGNHYYLAPNGRIAVMGRPASPSGAPDDEMLWVDRRRPLIIDTERGPRFVQVPLFADRHVQLVTIERAEQAVRLSRALGLRLERTARGRHGRDA